MCKQFTFDCERIKLVVCPRYPPQHHLIAALCVDRLSISHCQCQLRGFDDIERRKKINMFCHIWLPNFSFLGKWVDESEISAACSPKLSLGLCLQLIGFHWFTFRDWTTTCFLSLPVCHVSYLCLHTCTVTT